MTNIGQGVSFFGDRRSHPYSQRWSLGVQQELPMKAMIEVSYVGNRNTRLNINRELSYTPAQYLSKSPVRDQATIDYLGQNFPNPYAGLNPIYGANMTQGQACCGTTPSSRASSIRPTRPATPGITRCRAASNAALPIPGPSRLPTRGRRPWRLRSSSTLPTPCRMRASQGWIARTA